MILSRPLASLILFLEQISFKFMLKQQDSFYPMTFEHTQTHSWTLTCSISDYIKLV